MSRRRILLLRSGVVRLVRGPKENIVRPTIDPTFRTAARVYSARVTGVVLSGTLDDGTAGFAPIKERGGIAICPGPTRRIVSRIPRNAL